MKVDFEHVLGKIKPLHAVGQPPFFTMNDSYMHYLTEAHIPYSRLHDVGGAYGGSIYVDIPNIFRNFDADENDPDSYDFAFTDWLITALEKAECEPVYRLGVTIENYCGVRQYRLDPPKDFGKWARICEHIVRHYNEGWANGFTYDIKYWEIWNEPENGRGLPENMMWSGTPEQYYELYTVAYRHLKTCFGDSIKVGGYGSCGFYAAIGEAFPKEANCSARYETFLDFFENFLTYIKEHGAGLDFYSWHSYASCEADLYMADYADEVLTRHGFGDVETHLNEWNTAPRRNQRGTSFASASAAAVMLSQQYKKTYMMCFYDARIGTSVYGGLFNPLTFEPFCTYYSFKAFGELYMLGTQTECDTGMEKVYAAAAKDGEKKAVMISNLSGGDKLITFDLTSDFTVELIDEDHFLTKTELNPSRFTLKNDQVALIRNY